MVRLLGGAVFATLIGVAVGTGLDTPAPAGPGGGEDICRTSHVSHSVPYPHDPGGPIGLHAPRPLPAKARCAVCGMFPARHAHWAAQLIYEDGATHYVDSPAELLHFEANRARFDPDRAKDVVAARYLSDYRGAGWVPVEQAVLVIGADVPGPMRVPDLPAFANAAAAREFIRAHGGRMIGYGAEAAAQLDALRSAPRAPGAQAAARAGV
jgi:nitrous oxide reductase accessory protein NosL